MNPVWTQSARPDEISLSSTSFDSPGTPLAIHSTDPLNQLNQFDQAISDANLNGQINGQLGSLMALNTNLNAADPNGRDIN